MSEQPIIVIDDDPDDHEMIHRALRRLDPKLAVKKFFDGEEALRYLQTTSDNPFLILCDINMPIVNGFELKKQIDSDPVLRQKCIPFVFFTTTGNSDQVRKAYELHVHGFFSKGQSYEELKTSLETIIRYWQASKHPND